MLTKPLPGVMLNPLHPLSKGLVGCWLFNEGSGDIANDISGNKNHGTLKNMLPNTQGTKWQGSKFGGGLSFDGIDDYAEVADSASLDLITSGSVCVSFQCNTQGGAEALVNKGGNSSNKLDQYLLGWKWGHPSNLEISLGDGTTFQSLMTGSTLNTGQYYKVVATWDGDDLKIYVDGEISNSAPQTVTPFDDGQSLLFGPLITSNYFYDGMIDEVRIYNRTLSAHEAKQLSLDPFCNLMQVPAWQNYVPSVGLSMPVAMHHYEMLRA